MKYAVLVRHVDTITHMMGDAVRHTQTYIFPKYIGEDAIPVVFKTHEGLMFSAIELR